MQFQVQINISSHIKFSDLVNTFSLIWYFLIEKRSQKLSSTTRFKVCSIRKSTFFRKISLKSYWNMVKYLLEIFKYLWVLYKCAGWKKSIFFCEANHYGYFSNTVILNGLDWTLAEKWPGWKLWVICVGPNGRIRHQIYLKKVFKWIQTGGNIFVSILGSCKLHVSKRKSFSLSSTIDFSL